MDPDTAGLHTLLDREKIRDLRLRHLHRIFPDYLDWVLPGSSAVVMTQHILGQTLITLSGNTARSETHVIAYHRVDVGDDHIDTVIGGRYLDRLERRGGQLRIAERTMLYDWFQNFRTSADWTQGLMGVPFSGDHYTGRASGDVSDTFLTAHESPR